MIRTSVTCDQPDCMAIFVEPDDQLESFDTVAAAAGWKHSPIGYSCPACLIGRGPVLERGECPRCTGRTIDLPAGSTCLYCHHVVPHPEDDEW